MELSISDQLLKSEHILRGDIASLINECREAIKNAEIRLSQIETILNKMNWLRQAEISEILNRDDKIQEMFSKPVSGDK